MRREHERWTTALIVAVLVCAFVTFWAPAVLECDSLDVPQTSIADDKKWYEAAWDWLKEHAKGCDSDVFWWAHNR